VVPAIAFDDQVAAQRSLQALRSRPAILEAAIYRQDGKRYAQYARDGRLPRSPPSPRLMQGMRVSGQTLELAQPIQYNGETLGTLYVLARYDIVDRVRAYLGIFAVITALSFIAALILATPLLRTFIAPLESVAEVAQQIVERRDYSPRVARTTDDEIGIVVDALNRMLDEVQERALALQGSNDSLRSEIAVRERAEDALREADRRKDDFLATLAHELRNPLGPIRHATHILGSPAASDAQRATSRDVIARQVQHMALLLDDLLEISRITRGRLELRRKPSSLDELVASALEVARPLIDEKRHRLKVELTAEPVWLNVDPLRISQALANLLTNAAKYTDEGGNITVRAAVDDRDRSVVVSVADTGMGLSAEAMPRLFEMFSQVHGVLERSQGGLGIGLALVKGLVELHGGTVAASSPGPGLGSTFAFHLPASAVLPIAAIDRPAKSRPIAAPSHPAPGRILVADDNRDSAESLAELLRLEGYEVRIAASGPEVLALVQAEHIEMLILDIGMPGMTGYEVAEHIRKHDERDVRPLLIALTGWGRQEDIERALATGFDHHMRKPVDLDELRLHLSRFRASRLEPEQA
jgi:signal transduction histidine kinase/CheY-like chemotaxis protein